MTIQLLVTDENLTVQGDPLADWTSLDATMRFNEPGSGSVDLVAHPYVIAQLQPGNRLVVIRDDDIWMAGPMEISQDFSWGIGGEGEAPPGRVRVNFSDDLAVPAGYITFADPAVTWTNQPDTASYSLTSTNAETIIRTLVNVNCGPGALADRQIPNFALAAVTGVGTTTSVTTRFEGLLAACRRVAIDGGGLGFRTRQTASQIEFEVYAPADLTATARFSAGLGNLRALTYKRSAPTVTHALVQGSEVEAPASRVFVEAADPGAAAAWWRVEQLVSGTADDDTNGELTQDGTEALAEGAAPVELATVTVDTSDLKAGRDYGLGDRVTVALPTGLEVADLVRSIHLQATPDSGEYVTSLVGSPEATSDPQMVRLVRELGRRLGRLEAR
ncbi:siphovirus ReqiPepy6 Gp37-like family protein [Streptomyces sp. TRM68416]|uniref:siphovirus ReqiPepy6 Gp37-like family protein n=1 Tax=Streptomyces sp. TRM68416 TaxID=2758412 RepID=UPI001661DEC2|nr:siphovirus ReqiPepy6 Gp37-like family protein [Streptomyces sp. TRM68416]MBD0837364.1 siphovirus ReqiPepy6 Gp37-like family protein [Streptomyces sp. TRM68416]